MKKKLTKLVRLYLILGALYMLNEGVIHISNIRLTDIASIWPPSAITYASWMSIFYGSFSIFLSALFFVIQKGLEKYKQIIKLLAVFALFHGSILLFGSLTVNFNEIYQASPSLSFWLPSYHLFLLVEVALLFSFSLLVYFWQKD